MHNRISRSVRFISVLMTALLFVGFLPWRELKADMNTHGEYDAYPFEITYEQVSTWNNSTQGEYTITNTSDYEIRSWTIEVDYFGDTALSNIWNATDVTDYETDENILISGNVAIAAGESYSFGLIADGTDSAPVAPVDVNTVTFDSDEAAVTEETAVEETTEDVPETDTPDSVADIIPDTVSDITAEDAPAEEPSEEEEEAEPTIFPFAIYAGSTESDYTFAGWKSEITGDIYAGGNVLYQGSELYMDGTIYAGGTITADGWRIEVTDMVEDSEVFDMPDWSESILAKEEMLPAIDIADLESQDQILTNGYYYSEDDITINGTTFTGDVIIVSKGDITYNVETLNYGEEATGRILLYSEEGDITINGSRIEINGMLYAPNGRVSFNTYDTTINGRIVADEFSYSGSILNVKADYSDLQLATELPEVTVTGNLNSVYVGGYAFYTIEIPEDNVYDILYRLNGENVEVEIPEDEDAPIRYILDTDEEGEYTLEAYVSLPNGEFVLDSDTIEVIAEPTNTPTPEPTATNTPTPEPTATNTPTPTSTPTPEPTATNTPTPTSTPIPTVAPTATNTPTPRPTATNTPTPVPTATNTPTPTSTPTPEPTATPAPVIVPTPVNTVTPTPADSEIYGPTPFPTVTPTPTEAPVDPYSILSMGDPVYGYQRYYDLADWSIDSHYGARISETELRVGNRVNSYEITSYMDHTTQFSPDYSFSGRFTYSVDCDVDHDNCSNLTISACDENGLGQGSFTIHTDISPSRRHNWKDPYGQGDWQSGTEPSPSSIGIYLNNDQYHEYCYAEYMGFIESGSVHEIWFEYDGVDKILYVYVAPYDADGYVVKPDVPTLMLNIDLEEHFHGARYINLTVWGDGLDHPADFVYHGIEFDPYPYIHGDYDEEIYFLSPSDNAEVMQRENIDVFGIVNNDEAQTISVSLIDENGDPVFEETSDAVHYASQIASISTDGLDAGEYELLLCIYDEQGDLLAEKTSDISIIYDPVLEVEFNGYYNTADGIYIRGTINITEDSSWVVSINEEDTDSWTSVSTGSGNIDNDFIGFVPFEDIISWDHIDLMLVVTCESGAVAIRTTSLYFSYPISYTPSPTPTESPENTPGDYTDEELFCDIEDSQDGEEVTFITDVIGTVSGTELQDYTFDVYPVGSEDAVYSSTGTGEVEEDVVGTIDPTLLMNGFYRVVLRAEAEDGYVEDSIVVLVTGQAKVGNFSVSFLDMSLPVAGLPVEVYRTYDSRQRTVDGDFGYGWNMSVGGPSISVSGDLGSGWGYERRTVYSVPLNYWKEAYPHEINIDWENGSSETFALNLSSNGWITAPLYSISADMTNLDGTGDTLTILDNSRYLSYNQNDSTVITTRGAVWNPQNFLLTRYDGMKFYFNIDTGLYRVEDTYGRYIEITDDGIVYSEGGMISFNRDDNGRITSISDGLGNEVTYTYDEAGNLISVNDTANYTTSFAYDDSHYLTDITADNGVTVARNEYDDDGRLVATIDADGNRIEFSYDLDQRMEVTTDRLGYNTVYYYDENGNVTSITDALGRTTTYTYDANNNKTTETRPDGTTFSYSYDENGNLLTANDGNGRTISSTYGSHGELLTMSAMGNTELSMVYDEHGNLITATDSSGNTQDYGYDNSGNLTSVSDSLGSLMNMTYDGDGHVTSITNADGQVTNFSYDSEGRLTSRTITYQGTTLTDTYSYDAADRVTGITYANGNTVSYSYNQAGDVTSSTDSQGRTVNYSYDLYGNLTCISYPDGTSERFTYDLEGRNLTATDRMGRTATFTYDAVGNCTGKTYANGATESYTYDSCDRVISATNVLGGTTTYGYDYLGRNTSVTDPDGNTTTYTYNDRGNVSSVTDALGYTYTFTYDNMGNQTSVTYPNGSTYNSTYDVRGRMTSQSDAYGNTTTYSYDEMDRLVCVTDALGSSWTYEYDSKGNITSVTDAEGYTTTYTYDLNGQVTSVTNAAGNTATTSYDQYGRVISTTDFAGVETTYTYDSMDRVATTTVNGEVTTYSYSSVGNLVSVEDPTGTIFYTYNIDGYLSSVTNASGEVISYTYDEAGMVSSITIDGQTTSYGYDNMGRLVTVTDSEGTTSYTYDAVGNRATTEYPNGVTTTYGYNENNVLISEVSTDSTGTVLASYEYTIGANNERLSCTELNRTVEYEYDELERLVSETVTTGSTVSVTTYSYDANSNRVSMDKDGDVTTYEYNELNQLVRAGEVEYTWDNAGNLVSQTTTSGVIVATYTYDSYNRMVTASVNSGSGTLEQSYTYDYLGNRTSKTTDGVTTYYVTDLSSGYSQVLKATTGSDVIYYTRGFELISRNEGTTASYYLYDGGMSVRGITDESGALTDTYVFDAFGNEVARTGTTENSYCYRGEEQDETGLYYLRARYMDPSTGTFTTMDTYAGRLSDPMSLHKYLFANSNPVKYHDPSGHFSFAEMDAAMAIDRILDAGMISGFLYCLDANITDPEHQNHSLMGYFDSILRGLVIATVAIAFSNPVVLIALLALSSLSFMVKGVYDMTHGHPIYGGLEFAFGFIIAIMGVSWLQDAYAETKLEYARRWGLDEDRWYTLDEIHYHEHIEVNHSPEYEGLIPGKSRFVEGFDIQGGIDTALNSPDYISDPYAVGNNTRVYYEYTYDTPIGTDSHGRDLYTIRVVVDADDGFVVTAHPQ